MLDSPAVVQSRPAPTETFTVYVPLPSNWSSAPAGSMSPTAAGLRPTQTGVAFDGWVGARRGRR